MRQTLFLLLAALCGSFPGGSQAASKGGDGEADAARARPAVRQFAFVDTQGSFGTQVLTVRFPMPTLAGSAIFVRCQSAIDGQTQNVPNFTDDHGNQYLLTGDREIDPDGNVNTEQASAYAANIFAGTSEVTATWAPFGDYRSVMVVEVTGVSAAPLVGHASSLLRTSGAGVGNISSGRVADVPRNALVLALSTNESLTSPTPYQPDPGPDFTSAGTAINFGTPFNHGRLEYRLTTRHGKVEALFNATNAEEYMTFMIVFK